MRRTLRSAGVTLAAACVVGACASGPGSQATLEVYRSIGSVQCTGGGSSIAAMARQLAQAGVSVAHAGCGHDGRMRVAVCGAPDGAIAIFQIAESARQRAQALGYEPLAQLPGAVRSTCR